MKQPMHHFHVRIFNFLRVPEALFDPSIARQDADPVPLMPPHDWRRESGTAIDTEGFPGSRPRGICPLYQAISAKASNLAGEKETSALTRVMHPVTVVREMRHHSPAICPDTLVPDCKAALPTSLWDKRTQEPRWCRWTGSYTFSESAQDFYLLLLCCQPPHPLPHPLGF